MGSKTRCSTVVSRLVPLVALLVKRERADVFALPSIREFQAARELAYLGKHAFATLSNIFFALDIR